MVTNTIVGTLAVCATGTNSNEIETVPAQGTDHVLRGQANYNDLHDHLEDTFALERAEDFAECPPGYADTIGKDHGRIEIRHCWTIDAPGSLHHVDPDRER